MAVPRDSFLPTNTFQQKLRKLDAVDFMQKQYCYGCQKFCELFSSENHADLEVAGLPCKDQSLARKQAQREGPGGRALGGRSSSSMRRFTSRSGRPSSY